MPKKSRKAISWLMDDIIDGQLHADESAIVMPPDVYAQLRELMVNNHIGFSSGPHEVSVVPQHDSMWTNWNEEEPAINGHQFDALHYNTFAQGSQYTGPYQVDFRPKELCMPDKYTAVDLPTLYAHVYDFIYRYNGEDYQTGDHITSRYVKRNFMFQYPENAVQLALDDMRQAHILVDYHLHGDRHWIINRDLYAFN